MLSVTREAVFWIEARARRACRAVVCTCAWPGSFPIMVRRLPHRLMLSKHIDVVFGLALVLLRRGRLIGAAADVTVQHRAKPLHHLSVVREAAAEEMGEERRGRVAGKVIAVVMMPSPSPGS